MTHYSGSYPDKFSFTAADEFVVWFSAAKFKSAILTCAFTILALQQSYISPKCGKGRVGTFLRNREE